jgi:hypothetical protein
LLLIVTALLTGLIVPVVKAQMDHRKLQQQKLFEAEIARQGKIIDAQVQLLENLVRMLWEFQLFALAVSYYKFHGEAGKYDAALAEYDDKAWQYFGTIRAEISKARRLVSPPTYETLLKFYTDSLINLDTELMSAARSPRGDWNALHERIYSGMAKQTDDIVNLLAEELRLSKNVPAKF